MAAAGSPHRRGRAGVIGPLLSLLHAAYGVVGALPRPDMDPGAALPAPQAAMMTQIARGIASGFLVRERFVGVLLAGTDSLSGRSGSLTLAGPDLSALGVAVFNAAFVLFARLVSRARSANEKGRGNPSPSRTSDE